MTKADRRTLATFAAAVVLPLVLFLALQAAFSLREARRQVEADALNTARQINAAIDSELSIDRSALQVLASSQFVIAHDWVGARRRIAQVQAQRPRWRNVVFTDVASGQEIWQTRTSNRKIQPVRPWVRRYLAGGPNALTITGVVGQAPDCPCVAIHVPVLEQGRRRYLMTLELGAEDYQAILMRKAPSTGVTAIVDSDGLFVARTVDYPSKLGKPATHFVRDALGQGSQGLYQGVTYEGLKNYTAFQTSDLSNWSTHVAMKADLFSGPRSGAGLMTFVAALAALALAGLIATLGFRQIRSHRRQEVQTAQAQKLAAIGQLASGVAHDFNNLLMVISASLERISAKISDPDLRKPIDHALDASARGERLVQQLMAFTRSEPLDIGVVDLTALLDNLGGLLQQSVGSAISLRVETAPEARFVVSNASQLEMALVNLAVNARDAMPGGGSLTFRTRLSLNHPGFVDLEVVDTGAGMAPDVIDRAMEPFFTTKPVGKGTGLGLAQVFGLASQSGGVAEIQSAIGSGTTIRLRLPLHLAD